MPHEPPDRDRERQATDSTRTPSGVPAPVSEHEFDQDVPATSVEIPALADSPHSVQDDEALELSDVDVVDDAAPDAHASEPTGRTAPPPMPAEAASKRPPEIPYPSPRDLLARPALGERVGSGEAPALAEDAALPEISRAVLDRALAEVKGDDWKRRAEDLQAKLTQTTDKEQAALFAYELGELYEHRLRDEAQAVKAFSQALKADPSFRPNLWAIRRIFYRRALWPNLLKLIDAELRFAKSPAERADLYVEKGQILADRKNARGEARAAFDQAILQDPTGQTALLARERMALEDNERSVLCELWRKLAAAVTSPGRKVTYLLDLARLEAGSGEGGPARALELLAEAAALGVDRERVARMTEKIALSAGDVEACLTALEARIEGIAERCGKDLAIASASPDLTDGADDRQGLRHEILALRRRQAQVARDAGDHERAWDYLETAAALDPREPLLLMDLCTLAETLGKSEEQATLLARLLGEEAEPQRILALSLVRAQALERASRDADADAVIAALAAGWPGSLPVLAAKERSALRPGAWDKVAEVHMAMAQAARQGTAFGGDGDAEPAWAAAAWVTAGEVLHRVLSRPEDAQSAYAQALDVCPGYPPAVEASLFHCDLAMQDAVAARLAGEIDRATGARRVLLCERLLACAEEQDKPDLALRAVEALLESTPGDLWLLFHKDELLSKLGRTEERVAHTRVLVEKVPDPAAKAAVLCRMAELYDRQDRPALAIDALRAALAELPSDRVARAWLTCLLRETGRWEELSRERLYEASLGATATSELSEAAAILLHKLYRAPEAVELYRELCDRAPGDAAALRGLVVALAGRPSEQAIAMEREVLALKDDAARCQALLRLGERYETLGRTEDALSAYRRAADSTAGGAHAMWAVYDLSARAGDLQGIAEALRGLAQARTDDLLRADLLEELAWQSMGDRGRQVACFDEVLALSPERRGALLGRILALAAERGQDDPAGLSSAMIGTAERMPDPKVAASLFLYAATCDETRGGSQAGALAVRALAVVPGDAGAVLCAVDRRPANSGPPVHELWKRRTSMASTPELRVALDLEWASDCEASGRLAEAGRILARILAAAPHHLGALWALRRVAHRAGDVGTLARASLALGETLGDPSSACQLLVEAALLLVDVLRRPADAAPVFRAALERDPHHEIAYRRLHEIHTAAGEHAALLELVNLRARHLLRAVDALPYYLESASLRHKLGDLTGSAEDFSRVLALAPDSREALSGLAEVRLAGGAHKEAAAWLERYVALSDDPELEAAAWKKLALLRAEKLGDAALALPALEKVLEVHPGDLEVREVLVRVLTFLGFFERAATERVRIASRLEGKEARAREEVRAARLFERKLGDPARAVEALGRAQTLAPLDLGVLRPLYRLVPEKGRAAIAAVAMDAARSSLARSPTAAARYEHLAAVSALVGDGVSAEMARQAQLALGAADLWDGIDAVSGELGRPVRTLAEADWARLLPAKEGRVLSALWRGIAEGVVRGGPETTLAKKDLVSPKILAEKWPAVHAQMGALALNAEIYVSAEKPGYARAWPYSPPVVSLGADVAQAATPRMRFLLCRAMTHAVLGTGGLPASATELELWMAAAVKLAGGDPEKVPALARQAQSGRLEEQARALAKGLSRKDRKALPSLTERLAEVAEISPWFLATQAGVVRASLFLCGDLRATLAIGTEVKTGADLAENAAATEILLWATSEDYVAMRRELGL